MALLRLKRNEEKRLRGGHLWVFSNEIESIEGAPSTGDIVELFSHEKHALGVGVYNPRSLIAFRLLAQPGETIDRDFWKRRLQRAYEYRTQLFPGQCSCRVVFGESDGLPGLIVDKYEDFLAVQFLSAGIDKAAGPLLEAMREVFTPSGIMGRNDSLLRELEGLERKVEILYGELPDRVKIEENGSFFWADLRSGQKTGYFFDQRENRAAAARYCSGKTVLDCFCHTGSFGINAARGGASRVVCLDSSEPALALTGENIALNGFESTIETVKADAEEYLSSLIQRKDKFDIIMIDPPALIKSRKHFEAGFRAYRKLNTAAFSCLRRGDILVTSSCSHHLGPEEFRRMLREAAAKAGVQVDQS